MFLEPTPFRRCLPLTGGSARHRSAVLLLPMIILGMAACSKAPRTNPMAYQSPAQKPRLDPVIPGYTASGLKAEPQPGWVTDELLPDGQKPSGLIAVGVAQPNPLGDLAFQASVALADGRNKLAGRIKVKVQHMISRLDQTVSSAGNHTLSPEAQDRVVEGISRQLINTTLEGVSTLRWWTNPINDNLYVLLLLPGEEVDRDMGRATRREAEGEKQLHRALDGLDAFIEKSEAKEAGADPAPPS